MSALLLIAGAWSAFSIALIATGGAPPANPEITAEAAPVAMALRLFECFLAAGALAETEGPADTSSSGLTALSPCPALVRGWWLSLFDCCRRLPLIGSSNLDSSDHDIPITGYPDLSGREEHMPLTESNSTFPPASRPARDVHTSTGTDPSPGLISSLTEETSPSLEGRLGHSRYLPEARQQKSVGLSASGRESPRVTARSGARNGRVHDSEAWAAPPVSTAAPVFPVTCVHTASAASFAAV